MEDLLEILSGNNIIDEADVKYAAASGNKKEGKKRSKNTTHSGASSSLGAKEGPLSKQKEVC